MKEELKLLKDSGIKFEQNIEIGKNKTLKELKKKHDAVLIATGVYKPREVIYLDKFKKYFSSNGIFNSFKSKRFR